MEILGKYNLKEWASPLMYDLIIELLKNGPMNRKELVHSLKKPRTTIFDNLNTLQKSNVVSKFAKHNGDHGRPYVFWKLNIEVK